MRGCIFLLLAGGLIGGLVNPLPAEDLSIQAQVAEMPVRIRGLAVLALYPKPGPGTVRFRRDKPDDKGGIAVVRVLDPTGHCSAVEVLGSAQRSVTMVIPPGPAGVWRFAYSGGADQTTATFTVPATPYWGIRGEPALAAIVPAANWLWFPPGGGSLIVRRMSGARTDVRDDQGAILRETAAKQADTGWFQLPMAGGLWQLTSTGPFALDGMPILLCPTAEAAVALQAGAIKMGDTWLQGPLQARAQTWMNAAIRQDLIIRKVVIPDPATSAAPLQIGQLFGKYAPLPGLTAALANQVLESDSPDFGLVVPVDTRSARGDWRMGTRSGVTSPLDVVGLAALISADVHGNPYFQDPTLVRRAGLLACAQIRLLDGGDLIREGTLAEGQAPVVHAFFVYSGLSRGFELIQDQCDPALRAIWRDGLLAIADRLADHRVYQTNQWWHVLGGHHAVSLATGEIRVDGYFRNGMAENLRGEGGMKGLGQLPNGFFNENGGMDGNYDHLSTTCIATCWRRAQGAGQRDIAAALLGALQRNAEAASLFWLPQPDGTLVSPTLLNSRTDHPLAAPGWPGLKLVRDVVPLAATRWLLTSRPEQGLDPGTVFPHLINSETWARKAMQAAFQITATSSAVEATWTSEAIACAQQKTLAPAPLPCRSEHFSKELPGLSAARLGAFYVLQVGASGVPAAIWTESLGAILLAPRPARGEADKQVATWSAALDKQALVLTHKGPGEMTLPLCWQDAETGWQGADGSGVYTVRSAKVRLTWNGDKPAVLDQPLLLDGQATRLLHIPAQHLKIGSAMSIRFELLKSTP